MQTASLVSFVGVASTAVVGVALGARARIDGRATVIAMIACVSLLLTVAMARLHGRWLAVPVDAALVAAGCALGGAVGHRVQHPGHLLPACAVASAADLVSVLSPVGITRAVASSDRALAVLALSFPVPGTTAVAPALGAGDLVFCALLLGAAAAHALPYVRAALLAFVGVLCAGLLSARFEVPVPAIPTISLAVLLGVPHARRLSRKDRTVGTIAIGVAIGVALLAWLTRARR